MLLSEYSYLIPDIRGQYGYLEYQYFWVKTSAANELISATQNKLTNHNTIYLVIFYQLLWNHQLFYNNNNYECFNTYRKIKELLFRQNKSSTV